MQLIHALSYLIMLLLFMFTAVFLTWVAKFYRKKFSKGVSHHLMQGFLLVFASGIFLKTGYIEALPEITASIFLLVGSVGFVSLALGLYRTMMSPK